MQFPLFRYNINMHYWKGIFCGILTSATFGMIPLFTLPLIRGGMSFPSILFYRFLLAALLLGAVLFLGRKSFRVTWEELTALSWLSVLYTGSALFLFWGYDYLPSGVATTIIFLYPVFVAVIMALFFGEKPSWLVYLAILLALVGVALLSGVGSAEGIQLKGVLIEVLSALSYGLYIVGVNQSCVKHMGALKLTFYIFLFDTITFLLFAVWKGGLQPVPAGWGNINLVLLALVPTVFSNLSLVYAIKNIGSTFSSVLGAFEPLTAMVIGVLVFGEPFTRQLAWGLVCVICAVCLIILSPVIIKGWRRGKLFYITRLRGVHRNLFPYD